MALSGKVLQGTAWPGLAAHGVARLGFALRSAAWCGKVRHGVGEATRGKAMHSAAKAAKWQG